MVRLRVRPLVGAGAGPARCGDCSGKCAFAWWGGWAVDPSCCMSVGTIAFLKGSKGAGSRLAKLLKASSNGSSKWALAALPAGSCACATCCRGCAMCCCRWKPDVAAGAGAGAGARELPFRGEGRRAPSCSESDESG